MFVWILCKIRMFRSIARLRCNLLAFSPLLLIFVIERLQLIIGNACGFSSVFHIRLFGRITSFNVSGDILLAEINREMRFRKFMPGHGLIHVELDAHNVGKLRKPRIHKKRRTIVRHSRSIRHMRCAIDFEIIELCFNGGIVEQFLSGRLVRQWSSRPTCICLSMPRSQLLRFWKRLGGFGKRARHSRKIASPLHMLGSFSICPNLSTSV